MMPPKKVIHPSTPAKLVRGITEKLREYYVFLELAEQISAHLEDRLNAGEYGELGDGQALAAALTEDIQKVSQDKHLRV
jgi:hypothetical protein